MIRMNYPINRFRQIGYRGFQHYYPVNSEKFSLKITQNENLTVNVSNDIEDIISKLESGNKDAINIIEGLGLNYSLTEYQKGYKIKFEQDGNTYTVAYNGESVNTEAQTLKTEEEAHSLVSQNNKPEPTLEEITPPTPPSAKDYLKNVTYSDGLEETLVDEEAYKSAMDDYKVQKAEYEKKISEHNENVLEQQKQDIINSTREEWDSFSQSIETLKTDLDTNGTNSIMMTSVINELETEYAKLIQRKLETNLKRLDNTTQFVNIKPADPPDRSLYETEEGYTEAMNVYTYQELLYEKRLKEIELKEKLYEKRIEKIDEQLDKIRQMLFGITI